MLGSRMRYLMALLTCVCYYFASGEWLSFVLLVLVAALPWFSLVVSLPALLRFRLSQAGVDALEMGEEAEAWLLGSCQWPMPPFRGRLRVRRNFTDEQWRYDPEKGLPTDHCGALSVSLEKCRVCDYLGLFSFPARCAGEKTVRIRPKKIPVPAPEDLRRSIAVRWRPKPGGGFAENHELRDYRPGDNLNQVHWKLSAKAGKLILREPMEPMRGRILLTMTLRGTAEELDRKFGRLAWMGSWLLQQDIAFEIRALTGAGVLTLPVATEQDLKKSVDTLLCQKTTAQGSIEDRSYSAFWQFHIGGDADAV